MARDDEVAERPLTMRGSDDEFFTVEGDRQPEIHFDCVRVTVEEVVP